MHEKAVLVFVIGRVDVASEQNSVGNVITVGRISRLVDYTEIGVDLQLSRRHQQKSRSRSLGAFAAEALTSGLDTGTRCDAVQPLVYFFLERTHS